MGLLSDARWFAPVRRGYNWIRRNAFARGQAAIPQLAPAGRIRPSVLVLGIYLADRPNTVSHLVRGFAEATRYSVTQRWIALRGALPDPDIAAVTVDRIGELVPKFILLNRMLSQIDWRPFDYLVFTDDDIVTQRGFLDAFLGWQGQLDLALAQPARTQYSFADRKFCRQRKGIRGRQTRFVEIGPLFSVRRDLAPRIVPFDESSPMGWGYDFVWPVIAESAGARIGIIDVTPVDHSLRGQAVAYSNQAAGQAMQAYLARRRHLSKDEAFTVLQTFRA
jgi:hypothetical protein